MLPPATTPSDSVSATVPAASTLVAEDTLQVPAERSGDQSSDHLLGAT